VRRIKARTPKLRVETLVGDFRGSQDDIETVVVDGRPDVFAHNVEVVPRLQRSIRDARCSWDQSIDVLAHAKAIGSRVTKSSLMVGLGESRDEVVEAMTLLRDADVDVITIGQYLRPTKRHANVERYVEPDEFAEYERIGQELGFAFVASGPLVRSSYRAAEAFLTGALAEHDAEPARMDRYGKKRKLSVLT
jgi:lipoic acid synthetase